VQYDLVLGTYSGLNRTKAFRAESSSRHVIVVYQPALEQLCGSDRERLEQEIRRVLLHELAHHLGMPHKRMKSSWNRRATIFAARVHRLQQGLAGFEGPVGQGVPTYRARLARPRTLRRSV